MYHQHNDIEKVLFDAEAIQRRVIDLGYEISCNYGSTEITIVSVFKGAVPFTWDLMKNISNPCTLNFVQASSYRGGTTSGSLRIEGLLELDLYNKDVLIIDDILDSGRTMHKLVQWVQDEQPRTLKTCVLLDKPTCHQKQIKADYVGFEVPDEFVVGYGLDYRELYRNFNYIGLLKQSIYDKA